MKKPAKARFPPASTPASASTATSRASAPPPEKSAAREPAPGNSSAYERKKAGFARCLTVYGRNSVLEALQSPGVRCERLHLAGSNRPAEVLDRIVTIARSQGASIHTHDRTALARISRNGREDQGVAADLLWQGYCQIDALLGAEPPACATLLAVDGITNPQNLGMLIRSVTAAGAAGVLLPRKGCCDIGPLVIKASAGTLFRATIVRCDELAETLARLRACGWRIATLATNGTHSLFGLDDASARVFVLGSESGGVSAEVEALAAERVSIPMANGVESLNVAVTAALVAYHATSIGKRASSD